MGWKKFDKKDLENSLSFLTKKEYLCISLTDRIKRWRENGRWTFPLRGYLYQEDNGKITSALFLTKEGLAVPVSLPEDFPKGLPEQDLLPLPLQNCHTLMGSLEDIKLLGKSIPLEPYKHICFHMMTYPGGEFPSLSLSRDYRIFRATERDAEKLLDLQVDYEKEEVALVPSKINPLATFENLKRSLSRQTILYIEHQGKPIAKAGTNALGYLYEQLGGVYTKPEYRCRGISKYLITKLGTEILSRDRGISLFVKRDNIPALRVYESLGFLKREPFSIVYYR